MVAILWAGEGAVASHDTALAVYGLADAMPPVIHLTVDRRFRRRRDDVIIHRARLDNDAVTLREGHPDHNTPAYHRRRTADPSVAVAAATEAVERGLVRAGHLRAAATTVPQLRPILERMPSA